MKAVLFLPLLLLAACASGPQETISYTYNEIQIVNNSSQPIYGLNLRQGVSGLSFACGDITPFGQCQHFFGRRPYQDGPYEVDWAIGGGPRQTTLVNVQIPNYNALGNPLYVIFEIDQDAMLSARFVQKIPG